MTSREFMTTLRRRSAILKETLEEVFNPSPKVMRRVIERSPLFLRFGWNPMYMTPYRKNIVKPCLPTPVSFATQTLLRLPPIATALVQKDYHRKISVVMRAKDRDELYSGVRMPGAVNQRVTFDHP